MDKPAPSAQPIHPLLAGRWSPRAFDGSRTIAKRDWSGLLEAAIWAPSCSNEQPWRFVVGARGDDEVASARWQAIYDSLEAGNQRWCVHAAVFVVTLATRTFARSGAANPWARHDVGMASLQLALEAHARGLATHPMAGWDGDALRARLAIPEALDLVAVWAIGYPGDVDALDEGLRARELAPRQRLALHEVVLP